MSGVVEVIKVDGQPLAIGRFVHLNIKGDPTPIPAMVISLSPHLPGCVDLKLFITARLRTRLDNFLLSGSTALAVEKEEVIDCHHESAVSNAPRGSMSWTWPPRK